MHDLPAPSAYVAIDPAAWTRAAQIRWPSATRTVAVFEGSSDAKHELLRVAGDRHEFRFAQYGDELVVVVGLEPGIEGGREARDFLAAHEAFHLAAQMYGASLPYAYMDLAPRLVQHYSAGEAYAALHDAVDDMHRRSRQLPGSSECKALVAAYENLNEDARTYFNYKAFWEWPAEFYAYSVTFDGRLERYEEFRARAFRGDTGYRLFVSGVKVGELIEARMARSRWQTLAAEGRSMLSIFSELYGCGIELDETATYRIMRIDYTPPD